MTDVKPIQKTPDIDRGFTRITDGQIHYRAAGQKSSQPPLICLHASPASSKSLLPLMRAAAPTRYVIAPDTMGNGASDAPAVSAPDLSYYAGSMDRFCDAMGFDQVDIYGIHTGAHIATEWAILNPMRVRRVVLDQLTVLTDQQKIEFSAHYAPEMKPDQTGSQFHWAWNFMRDQMVFFPYYKKDADHLRQGGTFDAKILHDLTLDVLNSLETYHMAYGAVFKHELEERLPLLTQECLWVPGDPDPKNPASTLILQHLGNARLGVADPVNRPQALAGLINGFLD